MPRCWQELSVSTKGKLRTLELQALKGMKFFTSGMTLINKRTFWLLSLTVGAGSCRVEGDLGCSTWIYMNPTLSDFRGRDSMTFTDSHMAYDSLIKHHWSRQYFPKCGTCHRWYRRWFSGGPWTSLFSSWLYSFWCIFEKIQQAHQNHNVLIHFTN